MHHRLAVDSSVQRPWHDHTAGDDAETKSTRYIHNLRTHLALCYVYIYSQPVPELAKFKHN